MSEAAARNAAEPDWSIRVAPLAALVAAAFAAWWAWHGPVQFLDAGSYASAIDALAHGHGSTTTLAPSFSHVTAASFVARGGRVSFVDFPLGYPFVAVPVALFTGAKHAMLFVGVVALAVLAGGIAHGPRVAPRHLARVIARAVVGIAVVAVPISRGVLLGGLAEPLFLALVVLTAALTLDDVTAPSPQPRSAVDIVGESRTTDRRLGWAVAAAAAAGLVRFVGVVVLLVPIIVVWRRRGARRAGTWSALGVAPAAVNLVWAAASGSGHHLALRSLDGSDWRTFVHSIGGWVWHSSGSFDLTGASPPWWAVIAALAWIGACAVAIISLIGARGWLPRELEVCLSMAGLLAFTVLVAMISFDSLVRLDNRLMLPSGVLTVVGIVWWASRRLDGRVVIAATLVWAALAVGPWDVHRPAREHADASALRAATAGASVVITDDADRVWWRTGTPSAYLPRGRDLLTDETVDVAAAMDALVCPLAEHHGIIVVLGGPFADRTAVDELPRLLEENTVVHERAADGIDIYRPTGIGC